MQPKLLLQLLLLVQVLRSAAHARGLSGGQPAIIEGARRQLNEIALPSGRLPLSSTAVARVAVSTHSTNGRFPLQGWHGWRPQTPLRYKKRKREAMDAPGEGCMLQRQQRRVQQRRRPEGPINPPSASLVQSPVCAHRWRQTGACRYQQPSRQRRASVCRHPQRNARPCRRRMAGGHGRQRRWRRDCPPVSGIRHQPAWRAPGAAAVGSGRWAVQGRSLVPTHLVLPCCAASLRIRRHGPSEAPAMRLQALHAAPSPRPLCLQQRSAADR